MEEKAFFEAETLETAIDSAAELIRAHNIDAVKLLDSLPPESANKLNDLLVQMLSDLPHEVVTVVEHETPPVEIRGYGARIHAPKDADGRPAKMLFFRVRQAAPSMAIYLVGLAVVFSILPLATGVAPAVIPTLMVAKTAWENIVKLEGAADSTAMRCYEALLRCRSAHPERTSDPTIAELRPFTTVNEEEPLSIDRIVLGLKHLLDQQLVAVSAWGSDAGRIEDPGNRWKVTI